MSAISYVEEVKRKLIHLSSLWMPVAILFTDSLMGIMRQNSRGKIPMTKHSTKTENSVSNVVIDVTKTGDIRTNDFNLDKDKIPALSTIRTQIRSAKTIIETAHTVPIRTEFDRLKIGINIICYGKRIDFLNIGMEEVDEPTKPPTYLEDRDRRLALERACHDWLYSNPLPDDDEDDNKGWCKVFVLCLFF